MSSTFRGSTFDSSSFDNNTDLVHQKKTSLLDKVFQKRTDLGFSSANLKDRSVEALDADTVRINPSVADKAFDPMVKPVDVRLKSNNFGESFNAFETSHDNEDDPEVAARLQKQRDTIDNEWTHGWFNPATNQDVYDRGNASKQVLTDKLKTVNEGKTGLDFALGEKIQLDKFGRPLGDMKFSNEDVSAIDAMNTPELNASYNTPYNFAKVNKDGGGLIDTAKDFAGTLLTKTPTVLGNIAVGTHGLASAMVNAPTQALGNIVGGDTGDSIKKFGDIASTYELQNILQNRTHYAKPLVDALPISDEAKDTLNNLKYEPNRLDATTDKLYQSDALAKSRQDSEYRSNQTQRLRDELGYKPKGVYESAMALSSDVVDSLQAFVENPRATLTHDLPANIAQLAVPIGVTGRIVDNIAMKIASKTSGGVVDGVITQVGKDAATKYISSAPVQKQLLAIGGLTEGTQAASSIVNQAEEANVSPSQYLAPAIVGGVVTGLIGTGSNKLLGATAADALVGVNRVKGSAFTKALKAFTSEGIVEEFPQSVNEQLATNIALGKENVIEGVGQAGGSGAIVGGLLGGGMHTPILLQDVLQARKTPSVEPTSVSEEKPSTIEDLTPSKVDIKAYEDSVNNITDDNRQEVINQGIKDYPVDGTLPEKIQMAVAIGKARDGFNSPEHDAIYRQINAEIQLQNFAKGMPNFNDVISDPNTSIEDIQDNLITGAVDSTSENTGSLFNDIGRTKDEDTLNILKDISIAKQKEYAESDTVNDPYVLVTTGIETKNLPKESSEVFSSITRNEYTDLNQGLTLLSSHVKSATTPEQKNTGISALTKTISKVYSDKVDITSATERSVKQALNTINGLVNNKGTITIEPSDTLEQIHNKILPTFGSTPIKGSSSNPKANAFIKATNKVLQGAQTLSKFLTQKYVNDKTTGEVHQEIIDGKGEKLSVLDHATIISGKIADTNSDEESVNRAFNRFTNWVDFHTQKAELSTALGAIPESNKKAQQIIETALETLQGQDTFKEFKSNPIIWTKGLSSLAETMNAEVFFMQNTLDTLQELKDARFGSKNTATQVTSTAESISQTDENALDLTNVNQEDTIEEINMDDIPEKSVTSKESSFNEEQEKIYQDYEAEQDSQQQAQNEPTSNEISKSEEVITSEKKASVTVSTELTEVSLDNEQTQDLLEVPLPPEDTKNYSELINRTYFPFSTEEQLKSIRIFFFANALKNKIPEAKARFLYLQELATNNKDTINETFDLPIWRFDIIRPYSLTHKWKDGKLVSKTRAVITSLIDNTKQFFSDLFNIKNDNLFNRIPNLLEHIQQNKLVNNDSLDAIVKFHTDFVKTFEANINPELLKESLSDNAASSLFVYDPKKGKTYLEPNTLFAMSLGSIQFLQTALSTVYNDDDAIRSIVGLKEGDNLPAYVRDLLSDKGSVANIMKNQLGASLSKLLGVTYKPDTTLPQIEGFEASLGAYALRTLIDIKLLEETQIEKSTINAMKNQLEEGTLPGNQKTQDIVNKLYIGATTFVRVAAQKNIETGRPEVKSEIKELLEAIKPASKELDDLLNTTFSEALPSGSKTSLKALKKWLGKTWQGSNAEYTEAEYKAIKKYNDTAYTAETKAMNAALILDEEFIKQVALGEQYTDVVQKHFEKTRAGKELQAENEYKYLMDSFDVFKEHGSLYFLSKFWKQGRVGMEKGPQNSKMMRWLFAPKGVEYEVNLSNKESSKFFKLAVVAAFGTKIDQILDTALDKEFDALLVKYKDVLEDYSKTKGYTENVTQEMKDTLLDAIYAGKEGFHSYAGLLELAHYNENKDKGKFTSQLMREDDGITNGPAIGWLLFNGGDNKRVLDGFAIFTDSHEDTFTTHMAKEGSADNYNLMGQKAKENQVIVNNKLEELNTYLTENPTVRSSIFRIKYYDKKNGTDSFNAWFYKQGLGDMFATNSYEFGLLLNVIEESKTLIDTNEGKKKANYKENLQPTLNAIHSMVGELNRSFAKMPLMTLIFGSGINKIASNIGYIAIDSMYEKIQKVIRSKPKNQEEIDAQRILLKEIEDNIIELTGYDIPLPLNEDKEEDASLYSNSVAEDYDSTLAAYSIEALKNFKLPIYVEKKLAKQIANVYVPIIRASVNANFQTFIDNRKAINQIYDIGNTVLKTHIEHEVSLVLKDGLTKQKLLDIFEKAVKLMPSMKVPNFDGTEREIFYWNKDESSSTMPEFKVQVKRKKNKEILSFSYLDDNGEVHTSKPVILNSSTDTGHAVGILLEAIGVRTPIMTIHYTDSLPVKEIMNSNLISTMVHDARIGAANTSDEGSYLMNKKLLESINLLNPFKQATDYLQQVFDNLPKGDSKLSSKLKDALEKPLKEAFKNKQTVPHVQQGKRKVSPLVYNKENSGKQFKDYLGYLNEWVKYQTGVKNEIAKSIKAFGNYGGNATFKPQMVEAVKQDNFRELVAEEFKDVLKNISLGKGNKPLNDITDKLINLYTQVNVVETLQEFINRIDTLGLTIEQFKQHQTNIENKILGTSKQETKTKPNKSNKEEVTNSTTQTNGDKLVILPIGTSGSGKSTWIKSLKGEYVIISPDEMRVEFTGSMDDKSQDKEIYEAVKQRTIKAINQGKQVIIDSTNLQRDRRRDFTNAILQAIPDANVVYKLLPLNPELAKQRIKAQIDKGENRANVPDSSIDRHAELYKEMLNDIKDEPIKEFKEQTNEDIPFILTKDKVQKLKEFLTKYINQSSTYSIKEVLTLVNTKAPDFKDMDIVKYMYGQLLSTYYSDTKQKEDFEKGNNTPDQFYAHKNYWNTRKEYGLRLVKDNQSGKVKLQNINKQLNENNKPLGSTPDAKDLLTDIEDLKKDITTENIVSEFDAMPKGDDETHNTFLRNFVSQVIAPVVEATELLLFSKATYTYGQYSAELKKVAINLGQALQEQYSPFKMSAQEVFAHEFSHAVTWTAYQMPKNGTLKRKIDSLFYNVRREFNKAKLIDTSLANWDYVFNNADTIKVDNAPNSLGEVTTTSYDRGIQEFIAFGTTNKEFRNLIKRLQPKQLKVNQVYEGTGSDVIKEASWLETITNIFKKILDSFMRIAKGNDYLEPLTQFDTNVRLILAANIDKPFINITAITDKVEAEVAKKTNEGFKKGLRIIAKGRNSKVQAIRSAAKLADAVPAIGGFQTNQVVRQTLKLITNPTARQFALDLVKDIADVNENSKPITNTTIQQKTADADRNKATDSDENNWSKRVTLNHEQDIAYNSVLVRGDYESLNDAYGNDAIKLLKDKSFRDKEIKLIEDQIYNLKSKALNLANLMVHGKNMFNGMTEHNAVLIAKQGRSISQDKYQKEIDLVTKLSRLYAIGLQDENQVNQIISLLESNFDGMKQMLKVHKELKKQQLSEIDALTVIDGKTHTTLDPNKTIFLGTKEDEKHLVSDWKAKVIGRLERDPNDPLSTEGILYLVDVKMQNDWDAKAMATTDITPGSSNFQSGIVKTDRFKAEENREKAKLKEDGTNTKNHIFTRNNSNVSRVAIHNAQGKIIRYEYILDRETQEKYLNPRINVLRDLAAQKNGTAYRAKAYELNHKLVDALFDYWKKLGHDARKDMIWVGSDSKYSDLYNTIPTETKEYITKIFGTKNGFYMAEEELREVFGYRKQSITNWIQPVQADNLKKTIGNMIYEQAKRFGLNQANIKAIETMWIEGIAIAKDTIVVKSGVVSAANESSNFMTAKLAGVPIGFYYKNKISAMKAEQEYRRNSHAYLSHLSNAYGNPEYITKEIAQEMSILESALSTNEMSYLHDEGLASTVAEEGSYKDKHQTMLFNKTERARNIFDKLPKVVKDTLKIASISEGTKIYKLLDEIAQMGDITSRHVLVKWEEEKARQQGKEFDKNKAIDLSKFLFIQYHTVTNDLVQYGNDIGLLMFTKFAVKTLKVLTYMVGQHPARLLALGIFEELFATTEWIWHTSMNKLANPITSALATIDANPIVNLLVTPPAYMPQEVLGALSTLPLVP